MNSSPRVPSLVAGSIVAISLAGSSLVALSRAAPQTVPALPLADRIRIAEAFRLADALGNGVWPGWDKAPFALLLVTPDHEFLIRHPSPSTDFTLIGQDDALREKVWFRPRKHATNLLATFPAVGGVSTIVIGQPANTESKTSSRWVITLLHEHFHQYQDSRPGHHEAVNAMGLARGDETGMWMLDYPFPYTDPEVMARFSDLCRALAAALQARAQEEFGKRRSAYADARDRFRTSLAPDDWKYFAFQIWKEGIARYTEYRLASLAATKYQPTAAFRGLEDFVPFEEIARGILRGIEKEMSNVRLDESRRTVVYNFGAAEGLVLDEAGQDWRKTYFEDRFSLDRHWRQP